MKQTQGPAVQAVDRAMKILSALAGPTGGRRLKDLARETNTHPSTAHRLLTTMERQEFVHYDHADSTWHVGRNAFLAATGFLGGMAFVPVAKPLVKKMRDTIQETCSLGAIEGQEILILAQFQGREIERIISRVGRCLPLSPSAMGHALLAAWSDRRDKPDAVAKAIATMVDKSSAHSAECLLGTVKRAGFAVSEERAIHGVRTMASAVCDATGMPICAISIAGTIDRLSLDRIEEVGAILVAMAGEISQAITATAVRNASA